MRRILIVAMLMISVVGSITHAESKAPEWLLIIPRLQIGVQVIELPRTGKTWDVAQLSWRAGHFEGSAMPGEGGNVVIGGHSSTIFRPLGLLAVGDYITLIRGERRYDYRVTRMYTVMPDRPASALGTEDRLTLITCDGDRRLVVEALP